MTGACVAVSIVLEMRGIRPGTAQSIRRISAVLFAFVFALVESNTIARGVAVGVVSGSRCA